MIRRVHAIEFVRRVGNGRTQPAFIVCEDDGGIEIELIAKLPGGCFEGVGSLAFEAIGACLAGDLGIVVPEPFFVDISPAWLGSIADQEWVALTNGHPLVGFGSKYYGGGFATWQKPNALSETMIAAVARAAAFDCAIENSDRKSDNPNCLRSGERFLLIDHELCFQTILFRPKPWRAGGLHDFENRNQQIFIDALRGRTVDWSPIITSWQGLSDKMIDDYGTYLPAEWAAAASAVERAQTQIKLARDNIEGLVAEIERVLIC